jgi:hypothetical protein
MNYLILKTECDAWENKKNAMKMETVCLPETMVPTNMSTRRYYPERQRPCHYSCALNHFAIVVYKGPGGTRTMDLGIRWKLMFNLMI